MELNGVRSVDEEGREERHGTDELFARLAMPWDAKVKATEPMQSVGHFIDVRPCDGVLSEGHGIGFGPEPWISLSRYFAPSWLRVRQVRMRREVDDLSEKDVDMMLWRMSRFRT